MFILGQCIVHSRSWIRSHSSIVGTPLDGWSDNTIVFSKPPTTIIREGGDVFTAVNDWYYFSDTCTGTRNTLYDATNYGGCYQMVLSGEAENLNAYTT